MEPDAKPAFGVEFELLLKPKEKFTAQLEGECPGWAARFEEAKKIESQTSVQGGTGTNANTNPARAEVDALRLQFREQIAVLLRTLEIPAFTASHHYQEWSVVDEQKLDEVPGYCRVELVSRAIASNDDWQQEFDTIFRALNASFHMVCTTGCSTHIHVSPSAKPKGKQDRWTTEQLKNIMKAVSYYTSPVTKIMPAERKRNPYAMPNMLSDSIAKKQPKLRAAYDQVQTGSWKPLFDIYDDDMRRPLDRIKVFGIMGHDRYIAWNFQHVTDACGTVEFRQCPAITTSASAKHWASFTLAFIYAAVFQTDLNWTQTAFKTTHPYIEDLDAFVTAGSACLEPESQGALQRLEEDTSEARRWTAAEMAEILEKKALVDSQGTHESYAEKFDRTPDGTPVGSPTTSPRRSQKG